MVWKGAVSLSTKFLEHKSNTLFRTLKDLGDKSSGSYIILDEAFSIIFCNEKYTSLTDYSFQDIANSPFKNFLHHIKFNTKFEEIEERLRKGKITTAELVHTRKNGIAFYADLEFLPFQNKTNETELVIVFIKDVTFMQLQVFLDRLEKELFIAIQKDVPLIEKLELVCNGIDHLFHPYSFTSIILKQDDQLQMMQSGVFHQGKRIYYSLENALEVLCYRKMIELDTITIYDDIQNLTIHQRHKDIIIANEFTKGAIIPIQKADGERIGVMTIYYWEQNYDVKIYQQFMERIVDLIVLAHSYEKKQQQIYELAYMDTQTGMANRQGFIQHLEALSELSGVVYLLEPSEFSRIVELYGRDTGEKLIKQIYEQITKRCGKVQAIGRFSSSSIIFYWAHNEVEMPSIERLLKCLVERPFIIEGKSLYITLKSGGAAVEQAEALNDSIRHAESALSEAKNHSGTYAKFYTQERDAQLEKELFILHHLTEAIRNKEITAYFQPKVELRKGRITSMEALARWISPTFGFVSPADFIPIAERAGLIREIDLQIIEQVLIWFQKRQYEGKRIVPIAVNISPEHFYHPHFVSELEYLIKKYYADPNYLIIEITENIGLVNVERAQKIIQGLFVRGLKTSVDDFGIGYSSLSYLQKLMFTELKIDRSFTSRIQEAGTFAIVRSIIQIAYNLEIDVVAEGVETKEQMEILQQLGCKCVQGFLFYKPMSFAEIEEKNIL